jgi:dihydrodiol dehydrogenase / D-xylose 1-dehydrogenase (NADP)
MEKIIHWGILGTGRIATQFLEGLSNATGAQVTAVGSRAQDSAKIFGERFNIPNCYEGYENLVNDPELDVVYVSSPNTFHYEHSLSALRAGKAVLCEKPFTLNAHEAHELVHQARQRKLFLMEGMWTRFFPIMDRLRELLADRVIGEVHTLIADSGIRRSMETKERLFRLDLGGGALLDLGVYPISLASMIFGNPERIKVMAHFGEYEVDERMGILLGYPNGSLASLYTAIRTESPKEALILGSKGMIRIHANFITPTRLTITVNGESEQVIEESMLGNGMHFEADEIMRCLRAGEVESPLMPLDESVRIMETLDSIRAQLDFKFPSETINE